MVVAIVFGINSFWKISAHLCGIGGLCGAFFGLSWIFSANNLPLMLTLVLLSVLLGWARLECRAHTLPQLAAGFLLGFAGGFLPTAMLI